jgi:UDP-perosamine 4-acetyltransferase
MLDLIASQPGAPFEVVGLLDPDRNRHGTALAGSVILGDDALLPELRRSGVEGCFIGLGSVGSLAGRERLFELAIAAGVSPVTLIHPSAVVARSAVLGQGCAVMAGAILNPAVRLGVNVCVNTGAVVEHDCNIADHAFIGPGAVLAGGVAIGRAAFIGLRAAVIQGVSIGAKSIVGGGAMVIRDVPTQVTVVGVPARVIT